MLKHQSSSNWMIEDFLNLQTLPSLIAGKSPRLAIERIVSGFKRKNFATSSTVNSVFSPFAEPVLS